jgi:hypothetical protein
MGAFFSPRLLTELANEPAAFVAEIRARPTKPSIPLEEWLATLPAFRSIAELPTNSV